MSSIVVRPLVAADEAAWRRLFLDYAAFYRAELDDGTIDIVWRRLMSGQPGEHSGLAALDGGGALVGIAHFLIHRGTWSRTGYCYLEDLFVVSTLRGGGVGRALIEAVYAAADAAGCTRTYWVTETNNTEARRLYDRVATLAPYVQYRR